METVEIDKKIASLKEEIEKLEKEKNDSYKKTCEYWIGKYVTDGYGKFYIFDVEACEPESGGISCETVKVFMNERYKNFIIDANYPQFFLFECLKEITKEEFMEEFEKCVSAIKEIKEKYLK